MLDLIIARVGELNESFGRSTDCLINPSTERLVDPRTKATNYNDRRHSFQVSWSQTHFCCVSRAAATAVSETKKVLARPVQFSLEAARTEKIRTRVVHFCANISVDPPTGSFGCRCAFSNKDVQFDIRTIDGWITREVKGIIIAAHIFRRFVGSTGKSVSFAQDSCVPLG